MKNGPDPSYCNSYDPAECSESESIDDGLPDFISEDDIILNKTCDACPEQYDAYVGMMIVGYLRLRFGNFSVLCPGPGGEEVYSASVGGSWDGCFYDEAQRNKHLSLAISAIRSWVNTHRECLRP